MHLPIRDIERLTLLITRLLDAELLLDETGAALRAEADAARRCLEQGDARMARRHVEQVAGFTEALVRAGTLGPVDGRLVIETARRLLTETAG